MLVLGFAGSLRVGSYTHRLLRQSAGLVPHGVGWQEWDGLAAVPPFNADDEHRPD